MSKKTGFYIAFFMLLTVGFYFAVSALIPGFSKKRFPPVSKVQNFSFTSQDGQTFTNEGMKDKITVVNYFFTTCTSICPKMNNNIKPIYEAFKTNPEVMFLSFTSDPQRDSPAVLKRYADSMQVNTDKWKFLTGRKDSLYQTARHSFRLDNPDNYVTDERMDFIHTQFVALVNKKGEVVRIYDGIKPSEMSTMEDDIQALLQE